MNGGIRMAKERIGRLKDRAALEQAEKALALIAGFSRSRNTVSGT